MKYIIINGAFVLLLTLANGFTISQFVNDISGLLANRKEQELKQLEETLGTLLSENKKKELQLQAVEEMLSKLA